MLTEEWMKSNYSNGTGGSNCLEARRDAECVEVRDSKNDGKGPVFRFTYEDWRAFVRLTKGLGEAWPYQDLNGNYMVPEPNTYPATGGRWLRFTPDEWKAYVAGANDGQFDLEEIAA